MYTEFDCYNPHAYARLQEARSFLRLNAVKGNSEFALLYSKRFALANEEQIFFALKKMIVIKPIWFVEKSSGMAENNIVMEDKNRLRNLGINIKSERLRRDISQEKLAELTNISRNSISLIETGKINPTILKVIDIANVLGVDLPLLTRDV